MARSLKSWSQYSKKWQAARRKEGLDPRRWNRYRRLSEKTRNKIDPYEYAKGVSVKQQSYNSLLDSVTGKMDAIAQTYTSQNYSHKGFRPASIVVIRRRLSSYGYADLSKLDRMEPKRLYRHVTTVNQKIIDERGNSPLFYHAGGTA